MNRELGIVVVVVGGLALFFWYRRPKVLSRDRLEYSATARAAGLANRIPDRLLGRAGGLAVVGGQLEAMGGRVTSAFRSTLVNQSVGGVANSYHTKAQALDVVGLSLEEIKAHPVTGVGLVEALDEGDHIHLAWEADRLRELGQGVVW